MRRERLCVWASKCVCVWAGRGSVFVDVNVFRVGEVWRMGSKCAWDGIGSAHVDLNVCMCWREVVRMEI